MQVAGRRATQLRSLSNGYSPLGLQTSFLTHRQFPENGGEQSRSVSSLTLKGVGHLVRKGTGGRSSVSGIVATVFGATGFLGRYVVQQLAKVGSQVLVPFRGSEDSPRHLKVMGDLGQVVPMQYHPRDESSIKAVMAKANVVINLLGKDNETRNFSHEEVNIDFAEKIANIAKEHGGIMRYMHVSCLGASPTSPSRLRRAKAAGEEAVLSILPEATIFRPAVLIGTEDRFLNKIACGIRNWGRIPIFGDGSTKLQPVYVVDVATALVTALKDDGTSMGKIYELGGPDTYTMEELIKLVYDTVREEQRIYKVPFNVARLIATPRELLFRKIPCPTPRLRFFNTDFVNALSEDTLVNPDALQFEDLGFTPRKIKGYPIEYLFCYRRGGPHHGATLDHLPGPEAKIS